jgi:hypothetical protein
MSYPLLDIYTFGEHLLKSKDIDPVYVVLNNSGWSTELKARWCLAYWCTYHVGVASYVAAHEAPTEYWWTLGEVAQWRSLAARQGAPALAWRAGHQ